MSGTGGFQTQVYDQPAIGVAGDFANADPRSYYKAGPGGLVAGPGGVTIGAFAWAISPLDANAGPTLVNSFGSGNISGFVPRSQQGLNTTYLSNAGMTIVSGFQMALATGGAFIINNSGATQALRGMKAYASFLNGTASFAAAGSPTTASATASLISAGTAATFTGSIAGNILTASSVTNTIFPGAVLTGGTVATNTTVQKQISGTTGGAGTYYVDIPEQTVSSASLTATPYVLDTTGGTVTGTIVVGGVLITAAGTATGTVLGMSVASSYATGKWVMTRAQFLAAGTVTSGTVTISSNVETPFYALNSALAGEPVIIAAAVADFGPQLS